MDNPLDLFQQWLDDAKGYDTIDEPTSMTLATINSDGYPDTRVVLLKDVDDSGFVFYTNLTSTKATQLQQTPKAALNFHWMPLNRQVRIQGSVTPVTNAEADEYFASRPRQSQLGAWASKQSQPVESRLELEKRLAKYTAKFHVGKVPRPEFWSGFRLKPIRIEFWLKQPFRLHDRLEYTSTESGWNQRRLFP
ncbi:MAG: pyridoxamine 5'-phosphate oxidase [Candidatus Hydrogenedentota bacterium]|nr:MAG: pyridoxamine 5'-phosphate oxidase [Candidatus Hydrogenedentota bacterium]